jgi:hypothetical protein
MAAIDAGRVTLSVALIDRHSGQRRLVLRGSTVTIGGCAASVEMLTMLSATKRKMRSS